MNELAEDFGAQTPPAQIYTRQLVLRALRDDDAPVIAGYFQDWDVVKQTVAVPFPYDERSALTWIARVRRRIEAGSQHIFAIDQRSTGQMIGSIALTLGANDMRHQAELGYWIGKPHWGFGFASEAVRAMSDFATSVLGLSQIDAAVFRENQASARVLEKVGFKRERGVVRRYPDRGGRRHVIEYRLTPIDRSNHE